MRSTLRLACGLLVLGLVTGQAAHAENEVTALVDEGIGQIVTEEITQRMATFLEPYNISGLQTVSVSGKFRSLTSTTLEKQLVKSLERRGIKVDGSSPTRLVGTLAVTQTKEAAIVVLTCTLSEGSSGDLCTVRIRKILPVPSAN
ncbi:MAG: hypothetical protein KF861_08630 [Planctomycetaceae bacterium]|nr:hypothetical protein [Planctomycetaceae bacterium]